MSQPTPLPTAYEPRAASQGTVVEQSRAVAEVAAMVRIAQDQPRNIARATAAMREACSQHALATKAFFRFPRAGSTVEGPSVHLARELARVWGNLTYGVTELSRDDDKGVSEMLAYAWDVETNTRMAHIFIQPHERDTRQGRKRLTDLRDIYESNSNAGARRVREAIFGVLPAWFVEEAQRIAAESLAAGDGTKPLGQRVADAIRAFEGIGVTVDRIEAKFGGRKSDAWTEHDVAALGTIFQSIQRGEITVEDEFPAKRATADEITGGEPK